MTINKNNDKNKTHKKKSKCTYFSPTDTKYAIIKKRIVNFEWSEAKWEKLKASRNNTPGLRFGTQFVPPDINPAQTIFYVWGTVLLMQWNVVTMTVRGRYWFAVEETGLSHLLFSFSSELWRVTFWELETVTVSGMNVIFQRRYWTRQYYYSIECLTINASRAFI